MGKNGASFPRKNLDSFCSSSSSVEIISEEKFSKRTKNSASSSSQPLLSACSNCYKERTKSTGGRRHRRHKQVKSKTPIVICLKDSLDAARRLKQKDERVYNKDCQASTVTRNITTTTTTTTTSDNVGADPIYSRFQEDKGKKLQALLSEIEKPNQNETCGNIVKNLDLDTGQLCSACQNLNSSSHLLNNAPHRTRRNERSSRSLHHFQHSKGTNNVDVIRNDLFRGDGHDANPDSETAEYEDTSSLSSSSDSSNAYECDSMPRSRGDCMSIHDTFCCRRMPQKIAYGDSLEKLAQFTTGVPLYHYGSSLHYRCSMQVSNPWYQEGYHHSNNSKLEEYRYHVNNRSFEEYPYTDHNARTPPAVVSVSAEDAGLSDFSTTDQDSNRESESPLTSVDEGDADSNSEVDSNLDSENHQCVDCVYVDLTDTDVTFSVYYHENLFGLYNSYKKKKKQRRASAWGVPSWGTPLGFTNASSSYYPYTASWPWPYWSSMFFPNSSLPKTVMIPPKELKKFNVTQPPQRQWIPVQQRDCSRPTAVFTVMCYNVLCDKYCTRQLYGYCPTWALNWEYRKKGIMDEIKHYRADIISLQEVETDQFYNFFLPELKRDGYNGIFSPKSRARTMSEQERKHVDGCAIFFREAKFHFIKEYLIEFNQLAMANAEGNDDMLNRVMTKDNIGLAALLEVKEPHYETGMPADRLRGQPLLVATAHIHWDPEYSDVKLIQTMMLMWELKQIIEDTCRGYGLTAPTIDCNAIPLLLCGDLNSLPNSGVVEYLSTGKVAADHLDFKEYAYRSSLRKISTAEGKDALAHSFRLCRAYQGDTMPFTNYT
ncbi:uncharacterized protein LOC106872455 [Octopus bimaculoides]|uniref:uncharacterized protein LOC106872455 n=1 Tax=Octopus bimaculoides TaxID=37653 RepID=UPI00071CA95D|nr:uncharacterized protein LOC106872455 [Octopus bimaculoides]|eukprot:XP_014774950.1 PREDICTED: uncharacterized protein LOC106872455 [Octopus bimaculoides]